MITRKNIGILFIIFIFLESCQTKEPLTAPTNSETEREDLLVNDEGNLSFSRKSPRPQVILIPAKETFED